jgi:hypothetical protein
MSDGVSGALDSAEDGQDDTIATRTGALRVRAYRRRRHTNPRPGGTRRPALISDARQEWSMQPHLRVHRYTRDRRPALPFGATSSPDVRRGWSPPSCGGCSACPSGHVIPQSRPSPLDLGSADSTFPILWDQQRCPRVSGNTSRSAAQNPSGVNGYRNSSPGRQAPVPGHDEVRLGVRPGVSSRTESRRRFSGRGQ